MRPGEKFIEIRTGRFVNILLMILLFLVLAHLAGQVMKFVFGHGRLLGLVHLFNFNSEQNLPTLFSTLLLCISGGLSFILWKSEHLMVRNHWIWLFIAFIFFFLAVDEFTEIHESLSQPFHEYFNTSGLLYFAWVIPYGIILIILTVFFIPIWWQMEKKIRFRLALAGFIFVSGAVGFEMIGGWVFESSGDSVSLTTALLSMVEELLEMGGLILFIYLILDILSGDNQDFKIYIRSGNPSLVEEGEKE